jgi:hypothetical protein
LTASPAGRSIGTQPLASQLKRGFLRRSHERTWTLNQRAIYSGKVATERGRRQDEMQTISGLHALLANAVLAWNTSRMHETVERLRRSGVRIDDDWLRRMGPAHFGHINFRGTMRFGIERFAQSLIDDQAGSARQLRQV